MKITKQELMGILGVKSDTLKQNIIYKLKKIIWYGII